LFAAAAVSSASPAQAACTPTGFIRDSINLTAALINPLVVAGTINATGCDIGIYFSHGPVNVNNTVIAGARYFGIVVDGATTSMVDNITNNLIHNIGEVPFDGTPHGIGIYLAAFNNPIIGGKVTGNIVTAYQKGGIVANGKGVRLARLDNNTVEGLGHIDFLAQNGIQIGDGAMPFPGQVVGNHVFGNSYIGTPGDGSSAAGILVVGGPNFGLCGDVPQPCPYTRNVLIGLAASLDAVSSNVVLNNDVGIFSFNADVLGNAPASPPTNVIIIANIASDDRCFNPYQAGISDLGNTDSIAFNYIAQGGGYGPTCGIGIDVTGSINPQVSFNNVSPTASTEAAAPAGGAAAGAGPVDPGARRSRRSPQLRRAGPSTV
jgi:hypothetical protein